MESTASYLGGYTVLICIIIVIILFQVLLLRWALKINRIVWNLERINTKLRKLCEEKGLMTKTEIDG